jgi:allantoate deiminase
MTIAQRVMDRCDELALHTEEPGRVTRRFLTPPMQSVHRLITHWMRKLGMSVRVDATGNLVGRRPACDANKVGDNGTTSSRTRPSQRVLIVGSHLDTVPNAGKYDGILGVMLGLAMVELLGESPLPFAIDVIGFSEEEGVRYATPYLGSRGAAGNFDSTWLGLFDSSGVSMREAMIAFGLNPGEIDVAAYSPDNVIGFVEPHIEQGPVLERAGLPVGIVSQIVGQSRLVVHFRGEAGHAGTTPMVPRRDALVPAARLISSVQEIARRTDGMRATVGQVVVHPNASNVIPAEVYLSLDIRHGNDSIRLSTVDELVRLAAEFASDDGVDFGVTRRNHTDSVAVSPRMTSILHAAVGDAGIQTLEMVSGAGHDAVVMASRFPMAMLFLRHPGGISHHPDERVDIEDVAVAIDVLEKFVSRLAIEETGV